MSPGENDQFFRELEREVFDAFELPGDAETIESLYSSDFHSINADGSVTTKEEAVDIVDAGRFPVSDTVTNDETWVRRFGDVAVVTGRSKWVLEGDLTAVVRHTQLWAKQEGQWQMVGWQGTPVTEDSAVGPESGAN